MKQTIVFILFVCAGHGAQRRGGAANRGIKANREVTRR